MTRGRERAWLALSIIADGLIAAGAIDAAFQGEWLMCALFTLGLMYLGWVQRSTSRATRNATRNASNRAQAQQSRARGIADA